MKVFALPGFDHAPQVMNVALPEPAEGEVRVRVRAASVNGFDLAVANGYLKGALEHKFPLVLGKDFAGEIDSLGTGVTGYTVGDRVFGVVTKAALGDGSFGEYVTVPVTVGIAPLPSTIGFVEASALGLAGTAAVDAFDAAKITANTVVLVAGATGGVGQQALQLAAQVGAEVIATASSPEEIQLVTSFGATHTVDYRGDVAAQVASVHPGGVDVALHFAGSPQPLMAVMKKGGRFVSTILQDTAGIPADDVVITSIYANPSPATLARLARHHGDKHTALTVQRVYPLEDTGAAFSDFASGTLGKLVISVE